MVSSMSYLTILLMTRLFFLFLILRIGWLHWYKWRIGWRH